MMAHLNLDILVRLVHFQIDKVCQRQHVKEVVILHCQAAVAAAAS